MRPVPVPATGDARSLLAVVIMLATVGCSTGDSARGVDSGNTSIAAAAEGATTADSVPAATHVPEPPRPPLAPARDADQEFLRHMLDHHEAVIAVAHAQMMAPAGHAAHGGGADPTAFDARLDAEKLEMLALLSRLYGETFSPRADAYVAASTAGRVGIPATGAGGEHAEPSADLTPLLQAGVTLTDRFLPRLTWPEVRNVARRIRASQLELARMVPAPAAP